MTNVLSNLNDLPEGSVVECIEDVWLRHNGVPVSYCIFTKGLKYKVIRVTPKQLLAIVDIVKDKIVTYCILPDQGDRGITWEELNTKFRLYSTGVLLGGN